MASLQVTDPPISDVDDRFVAPTDSDRPVRVEPLVTGRSRSWRPVPPGEPRRAGRSVDDHLSGIAIRAMLGLGRTLIVIGILLLLFAGFQLWGTGLSEARAQAELTARFEQQLEDAATVGPAAVASESIHRPLEPLVVEVPTDPAAAASPVGGPAVDQKPEPIPVVAVGDPIGVLSIPAIDLTKTFSEGTTRDVLRGGPGHYPSTPIPGQRGNVAIAGHRTTHGAPFLDIDRLGAGDTITIKTVTGTYTYAVEGQLDADGNEIGHRIVAPEDVAVIMDKGDDRLTLTACHPKYSARQRIIVTAVLTSAPPPPAKPPVRTPGSEPNPQANAIIAAKPIKPAQADPSVVPQMPASPEQADLTAPAEVQPVEPAESLGWQPRYAGPTAAWAAATAFIALLGYGLGRLWRRFPACLMAVPPVSLSLYYCFVNLERFIPAV